MLADGRPPKWPARLAGAGGCRRFDRLRGLLCLLASELQSNKALGPVGAIGVVLAMLASMTFLPAMLALIGRPVFWPRKLKVCSCRPPVC